MEAELDPALLARIDALGPWHVQADWKGAFRLIFSGVRQSEVFSLPGMPLCWQWAKRKKRDPDFAVLALAAAAVLGRSGSRMTRDMVERMVAAFADGARSFATVSRLMDGKPSEASISRYYADNATFRARVAPYWRPPQKHADGEIERAVQAVESGVALANLSRVGLPSATALKARAAADPALAARLAAVQTAKAQKRERTYATVLTKLEAGVSGTALPALGLPSLDTLHKYRRRHVELNARVEAVLKPRWVPTYTPADYDRAIRAIEGGRSIKRLGELGLPGKTLIARLRRTDASFAARVAAAQRLRGGNIVGEDAQLRRSLSQNEVWSAVNAAVSRGLPSFVRDDVISEMVADVLEGYLEPADIRGAARGYVTEHFREAGGQRMRSLDADLYGDDGRTLHDLLEG